MLSPDLHDNTPMTESLLNPEEVEKVRNFIRRLAEILSRNFDKPAYDLDQLFPQYTPFVQNKEPQGDPELDD